MISWFEGFGWRLDLCAALLFSHRCAQAMDTGSTWMATSGGWLYHMLDGCDRLVGVSSFVRRLIDEGKEDGALLAVRRRFGAAWTAETHEALYSLLTLRTLDEGVSSSARGGFTALRPYCGMVASVRRDFSDLQERLQSETKSAAQASATVEVLERKMRACMPTGTWESQAYA